MKTCTVCKGAGEIRSTRWCYGGDDVHPEGEDIDVCEECWGAGLVEDDHDQGQENG